MADIIPSSGTMYFDPASLSPYSIQAHFPAHNLRQETHSMRKQIVTAAALLALALTAIGAVQVTADEAHVVCIPPAVIQALS
jgi:hypothetical protein